MIDVPPLPLRKLPLGLDGGPGYFRTLGTGTVTESFEAILDTRSRICFNENMTATTTECRVCHESIVVEAWESDICDSCNDGDRLDEV